MTYRPLIRYREVFPVYNSASEVDWPTNRPPVSDSPVFWKESTSSKIPTELTVNLLCFLALVILLCSGIDLSRRFGDQNQAMKDLAPLAIAALVFPVGILSSRMIAKEREGRT